MRTLKGLAALLALTALVVGIPAALVLLAGNPIPSTAELQQALTGIDFGGTFLMGTVLPLIAWGFWASFVYSLVVEVISLIRRVETPNLGGALRPQQALAGALIAAVLALGGGSPAFALTPQDTASAPAAVAMAQEGQTTQDTPAAAGERTYTVQEGDTLWSIARDELGQGSRWGELAEQMRSTPQADGQTLTDPDLIMTGWTVELPDGPTGAGSTSA
ncbi:LysM peptidoglycan-binding domain-containing protein, partial [Micrococcus sp. HSID17245]|uniref:LysM peptidoglycan-binding domain-containing protein n=1 Tax=Micrococcus sp. HSID17245 TaxID=2419508 RepID=UPI000F869BE6